MAAVALPGPELVGREVRIKKNQNRISGDKNPGRIGIISDIGIGGLVEVDLEPTEKAIARRESFWLRDLIFRDED